MRPEREVFEGMKNENIPSAVWFCHRISLR